MDNFLNKQLYFLSIHQKVKKIKLYFYSLNYGTLRYRKNILKTLKLLTVTFYSYALERIIVYYILCKI